MNLFKKFCQLDVKQVGIFLKKLNNQQQIKVVDQSYGDRLKIIIYKVLGCSKTIPLECSDIYNEFLVKLPSIIDLFNVEKDTNFESYLFKSVKNFALTRAKYWSRNKRSHVVNTLQNIENIDVVDTSWEKGLNSEIEKVDISNFLRCTKFSKTNFDALFIDKLSNNKFNNLATSSKKNTIKQEFVKKLNTFMN
ncbi:sigma factor [Mycoplasma simbae]|uniref:sigma factor n=1 Tax=Mycoplasma simbae TaxID=36744 RepID=UPI0004969178|nr:sigma factor [Mycoplasma simbae]